MMQTRFDPIVLTLECEHCDEHKLARVEVYLEFADGSQDWIPVCDDCLIDLSAE